MEGNFKMDKQDRIIELLEEILQGLKIIAQNQSVIDDTINSATDRNASYICGIGVFNTISDLYDGLENVAGEISNK